MVFWHLPTEFKVLNILNAGKYFQLNASVNLVGWLVVISKQDVHLLEYVKKTNKRCKCSNGTRLNTRIQAPL